MEAKLLILIADLCRQEITSPGVPPGKEFCLYPLQPLPLFCSIFQSLEVQGSNQGKDVGLEKPEIK